MFFNETLPDCCSSPACSESLKAESFQAAVNISSLFHSLIKDEFVLDEDVFDVFVGMSSMSAMRSLVGWGISLKLNFYLSFKGKKQNKNENVGNQLACG